MGKFRPTPWRIEYCTRLVGGEEGVERLREMYRSGASIKEIMMEFGLTSPMCIYVLVGERKRGGYRGWRRVTPELEREIVELRRRGLSMPEIASEVGVSVGSVYRVLKKYGLTGRVRRKGSRPSVGYQGEAEDGDGEYEDH